MQYKLLEMVFGFDELLDKLGNRAAFDILDEVLRRLSRLLRPHRARHLSLCRVRIYGVPRPLYRGLSCVCHRYKKRDDDIFRCNSQHFAMKKT